MLSLSVFCLCGACVLFFFQVFRQKDPFFLKILHEMREGRVSLEAEKILADKVGTQTAFTMPPRSRCVCVQYAILCLGEHADGGVALVRITTP